MKRLEIYKNELLRIENELGLTAENVVEEAKNPKNPLHNYFDWDDEVAGEKWRKHQARLLINIIVEPTEDNGDKIYSFEVIKGEYHHIDEILSNDEWRNRIQQQAVDQLKYWRSKYSQYSIKKFKPVISEISKLLENEDGKEKRKRKQEAVTA